MGLRFGESPEDLAADRRTVPLPSLARHMSYDGGRDKLKLGARGGDEATLGFGRPDLEERADKD
jgi:hypothetical protein